MHGPRRGIRILVADDERLFRDALRALLENENDFSVVGCAADGDETVRLASQLEPDVLLLDLAMPRIPGFDALRSLAEGQTAVRTVVLTGAITRDEVICALQLGARGVVLKEASPELLFSSIRAVAAGACWLGHEAIDGLLQALQSFPPPSPSATRRRPFNLTPRELDVVRAVVAGKSNKEIAQQFGISEDTVKHHLTKIFDKVGASTRLELALFAIHHRLQ
jgi:two-component system nitrate/nitrite response regulator NarL